MHSYIQRFSVIGALNYVLVEVYKKSNCAFIPTSNMNKAINQ